MGRLNASLHSSVASARRVSGLTQLQVARLVGVSRQTVVELEQGGYNPSTALALRLALLLDTTVEALFHLDEAQVTTLLASRENLRRGSHGGQVGDVAHGVAP